MAWACRCVATPVEAQVSEAEMVVYGEVVGITLGEPLSTAKFISVKVAKSYVGDAAPGATITVRTSQEESSCGLNVVEGQHWVFFVQRGGSSLCSSSRVVHDLATDAVIAEIEAAVSSEAGSERTSAWRWPRC